MKRGDKIHPTIVPLVNLDELYNAIISEVRSKSNLKSKYLYLGWHGAKAWKNVDSNYKISTQGIQILVDYFSEIDDIVRSTANGKKYNIVSLGSGTCDEDLKILDILFRKNNLSIIPPFRIYTVDISIDLLNEGAQKLAKKINNNHKLKNLVQDIVSINIDIEKLHSAQEIINQYKYKSSDTNLFHLLGLTLGNNNENSILSSIHNTMGTNDYLLLGVDFCADEEMLLNQTKEQYHSQEITDIINEYLCSPLIFASKYEKNSKTKHIKFSIDQFNELEIVFSEETTVSNIADSKSFVYYYKYNDTGGIHQMRVCFSNKYKSSSFKKYIEEELPKKDVYFEIIKDIRGFGHEETGQYLVLLKKIQKNRREIQLEKQQIISNKEKNAIVKVLELTNKEIASSSVDFSNSAAIMRNYNETIEYIKSKSSDETKLKLIIKIINIAKTQNNLINLHTSTQVYNLTK